SSRRRPVSATRPNGSSSSYSPTSATRGPTTDTGITAAPVSISCALTKGERSIDVTPSLKPSASWRALMLAGSFFRGHLFTASIIPHHGDRPADRDANRRPRGVRRRPAVLRAREAPGVAGQGPPLGRAAADPRRKRHAAAPGAAEGHVAFGPHTAAAGRTA